MVRKRGLFVDKVVQHFPESVCERILETIRWPLGIGCPSCLHREFKRFKRGKAGQKTVLQCRRCKRQFSITAGTIFHGSHLPLAKWFFATYLLTRQQPDGLTVEGLQRLLGTTYKTAWRVRQQISQLLREQQQYLRNLAPENPEPNSMERTEQPNLDVLAARFENELPYYFRKQLEQGKFETAVPKG